MTDRELLELAAKAAGHQIDPIDAMHEPDDWVCWNPLTDDGDALRLAVRLSITIDPGYGTHGIYAWQSFFKEKNGAFSFELINDAASTRRAIVRVAAEIGRNME